MRPDCLVTVVFAGMAIFTSSSWLPRRCGADGGGGTRCLKLRPDWRERVSPSRGMEAVDERAMGTF